MLFICMHCLVVIEEEEEEEEENLFNRKYMVWETSIKTTYGRWHRGHPYNVQT